MTTNYLAEFITLATIHFLAVVAPGPDFAISVTQSVRFGRAAGLLTALGIGTGISVHVFYTLLGVSALMHKTPWLLGAAKIIGAIYILYLGINLIMSKPKSVDFGLTGQIPQFEKQAPRKSFMVGFFTNATNPKATLFFLAIFTTVISETTPLKIQAFYGIWMCLVNALWFMIVSVFFSSTRIRKNFLHFGVWFERTMGLVLILFAGRLIIMWP